MTQKEKIEILEKENSRLQTEIDSLKSSSTNVNQKYRELAELKEKWENEISEMRKLRKKYKTLVNNYQKLISLKKMISD